MTCEICNGNGLVISDQYRRPVPCPACGDWSLLIARYEKRMHDLFEWSSYRPDYTIHDFFGLEQGVAAGKEIATVIAEAWIANPSAGLLCLAGPSGVGKTTLALAALYAVNELDPVFWIDAEHMFRAVQRGYSDGQADARIEALERIPILLIDDLGRVGHNIASDHVSRVLRAILDVRQQQKRPTIITTNLNEDQFSAQFDKTATTRMVRWANGLYEFAELNARGFCNMGGTAW